MWTTLKLNPKTSPHGYVWYQTSLGASGNLTHAEMIAHATKVLTEDRALSRPELLDHLNNGNFIIERTAS
jgi:hypothetical protein